MLLAYGNGVRVHYLASLAVGNVSAPVGSAHIPTNCGEGIESSGDWSERSRSQLFFYLAGWPVKEKKNSPPPFRLTFSAFAEQSALTGHRNVLRL